MAIPIEVQVESSHLVLQTDETEMTGFLLVREYSVCAAFDNVMRFPPRETWGI